MKISQYLLARLVVQKLIDNLLCSLNESNTKAKMAFLNWIFKMVFLKILANAN